MSLRSHISVVSAVDPSYVWDYIKFFGQPIISDLMRYKTICYGQKVNADLFCVFVDNVNY